MEYERLAGNIASPDASPGTVKVRLPMDGTEGPANAGPAASANLVSLFNQQELAKIATRVIEDYDDDEKSRANHMGRLRRWYELYAAVTKVKQWPWMNAANVNVPLLTYAVLQVHGRLFDMLLPAKGNIYQSVPTRASDPQEIDRAERTELFVNWYLREQVPEYRQSYDDTFFQMLIFGSAFRYAYWDYAENRLCVEWVSVEDLVIPYSCKVTDPSMRGVRRYTLVRHLSIFEIQDKGESGEYENTDKITPSTATADTQRDSEFKAAVDSVDGVERSSERRFLEDEDRDLLDQHRWLRMPDDVTRHPSFDGKPHPVIVTVDEGTRTVLRVVLREEDDPKDARRFAGEQAAFQAGQAPQEPKPARQREVTFFTHYKAFPSEGFYGLGLGHFLGPLNEAMNALLNQNIDRATTNNAGGGIIARGTRMQRGPVNKSPGEYVEVDLPPSQMKDAIQNWPQVQPDPEGRWFIQYIEQMANRVSGAGDTLSGEPVGANETARAALARNEQAQKQISVLASRTLGYLTCDARVIWRLFSVYLDEQEYHDVVDSVGKPRQVQIGRADFLADAKVYPTADPRLTSHAQRTEEAQNFLATVTNPQGPPELVQNPAVRRAAVDAYLYASDRHEMLELLGPPPGPPQPPPPKPQWAENAEFLREHDQPTNPQDDDDAHLIELQMFKQDPLGYQRLSPTGRKMIDNHERGHFAQKLEKARRQDDQRRQSAQAALHGANGGGPADMAPGAANGIPPGLDPGGMPEGLA